MTRPVLPVTPNSPPQPAATSGTPSGDFGQVLSNEISQQNTSQAASQPASTPAASAATKPGSTPVATSKTDTPSTKPDSKDSATTSTTPQGATAEMLAMMAYGQPAGASGGQPASASTTSPTAGTSVTAASLPVSSRPDTTGSLPDTSNASDATATATDAAALAAATGLPGTSQPATAAGVSARSLPGEKDLLNNQAQTKSTAVTNSTVLPSATDSKTAINNNNNTNQPALTPAATTAATADGNNGNAISALTTGHTGKNLPDASLAAGQAAVAQQNPALMQGVLAALPGDAIGHLAPRVGSQAWDEALSQRVVWMAHGAEQSATLSLNPPDLGPLRIVLNVSNNQANATFISQQPEVRQAIEAALPKLENMMMGAGIQLGQTSVRADTQGQPGQAFQFQQQSSGGNRRQTAAVAGIGPGISSTEKLTGGQGLVNTFV